MSIVMQGSLFGSPVVSGNIRDKMRYILTTYPAARNDYKLACFLYWREFEGLGEALGERAEAFREWFITQATSPKTLQNRAMEIQNWLPQLDASPEVEQQRQRQSKAGPVL